MQNFSNAKLAQKLKVSGLLLLGEVAFPQKQKFSNAKKIELFLNFLHFMTSSIKNEKRQKKHKYLSKDG